MPFLGHPLRLLVATLKGLALAHVGLTYGYSVGAGWGPSMLPTFMATQEWFVTDRRCRRGRGVRVGDCVAYGIPVETGEEGVKRVVGLPGDYVLLNSPGLLEDEDDDDDDEEDGGAGAAAAAAAAAAAGSMIQVPRGHCYIVGDNLPWSRDSRDFGPLPLGLIKGKVVAKVSFDSWNPLYWFSKVENGLRRPEALTRPS
ncbi:peptidase S24/S26A/S26B/S26C [Biscogniauxia mediterranea]|nr:peptidase S24/S26A/S26B/S26C [Biscogniauxia mediterranea]